MISLAENLLQEKNQKQKSNFNWPQLRRLIWQLPEKYTVSQWSDIYRVLDQRISAEPGPWHTDRTPYLREIMNAFADPYVEEITIKSSTQIGKTESILNMLAYAIDQDPGPALVVMPRKDDAKILSKDRVKPMIELSSGLSQHFTGDDDDITRFGMTLDRMNVYFAWANSPAALASKPIRYLFLDETNKYPPFSGKEADPIKLATERTKTFWNKKIIKVSTPTIEDGYISREYERSDKRKYYVPCPYCGRFQELIFSRVKFPKEERDPEDIRSGRLAWYECVECKKAIRDEAKLKMLLKGKWAPESCHIDKEGNIRGRQRKAAHRGYWLNALYSPWLGFSDIAAEFLSCREDIALLMNFVNSWLAEEWKEKIEERRPEKMITLIREYPRGKVPEGVITLTAGIDVQVDHLYYTVRGWGVGFQSWQIESDIVENWEQLIMRIYNREFLSMNDKIGNFFVRLGFVDSGHRTSEVYDTCRTLRDFLKPTKGFDDLRGQFYKIKRLEKYPDGKRMFGGLLLYELDVNMFKDKLARLMDINNPKWFMHLNPSDEYIKELCAEGKITRKDRRGAQREVWKKLSTHTKNNFWDAEVLALAAAEVLGVYRLTENDLPQPIQEGPESQKRTEGRKPWIDRGTKGWIQRG